MSMNKKISILVVLIIIIGAASLFIGSANVYVSEPVQMYNIIFSIRLPRVLFAIIVGASLAVSGVVYQVILRNPMADSFTLGMANGAVLGSATAVILSLPVLVQPLLSIITGLTGLAIVLMAAKRMDAAYSPVTLIITGVLLGAMMSGILYIIILMNPDETRSISGYMFGSLAGTSYETVSVTAVLTAISAVIVYKYGRQLDLLNLGDIRAFSLGVNVGRLRLLLLITASIPPLVAISFTGLIALVGIIVPQMILYFKPLLFRPLLIYSLLYGALYILIIDTIGRTIAAPLQIPTGVMVMISAVPIFIFLMQKNMLNRRY